MEARPWKCLRAAEMYYKTKIRVVSPLVKVELRISRIILQNEEILDSGTGSLELSFHYFSQFHQTNAGNVPKGITELSFNIYGGPTRMHAYTRYFMSLLT
jgi:hypothetical protein